MSKEQKDKGVIMSKKYDYLVVGAGLYGAVFAHEAKEAGKSVLVIDKRPNIAGNVTPIKRPTSSITPSHTPRKARWIIAVILNSR